MMKRGMIVGALALPLAGCLSLGGGKLPPVLLDLTPAQTAAAGSGGTGAPASAIVVSAPVTDLRLDVVRVPVQVSDSTVAYVKDAVWVERPARLFQHLLAETLRARGSRLVLESDTAPGATRLGGRLLDMGYDARRHAVVMRLEATRERGGVIAVRRFEDVVPAVAPLAAPVGAALNQAANRIAGAVADWAAGN